MAEAFATSGVRCRKGPSRPDASTNGWFFLLSVALIAASGAALPISDEVFVVQAMAATPAPKDRALAWIGAKAAQATESVRASQRELERAQSAASQAENAIGLAQRYNDAAAERVARDALATAQQAVFAAQRKVAEARAVELRMQAVLQNIAPGSTGFATEVQGQVLVGSGGVARPWNGSPIAFKPGDTISTGPASRAVVTLEGGATLVVRGNTTFTFRAQPNTDPNLPLTQRAQGYLQRGVIRLEEAVGSQGALGRFQVRTPTAVAAVRGTDFLLEATEDGTTRFTPISGEVALTAEGAAFKGTQWWIPAPSRTLTEGTRLTTGAGERASIDLPEGYKIALAPATVVEARTSGAMPVFVLRQGKMHVWGSGAEAKLRFVTPNSVIAPSAREFEVSVADGGLATITPVDGTVVVTSVRERLDWLKGKGLDD